MDEALSEIEALTSKRTSLRDKLKRKRETFETILAQGGEGEAVVPSSNDDKLDKKADPEVEKKKTKSEEDITSLLAMCSAKEKADNKQRDEIMELLGAKTAKEQSLMDSFQSQTLGVKEFCSYSTKSECKNMGGKCDKLHFAKIIQCHTDETLGDCSFLNTCFHMDSCKYIHYKVEDEEPENSSSSHNNNQNSSHLQIQDTDSDSANSTNIVKKSNLLHSMKLVPPQWVQCDLRSLKLPILGKFSVIMADPPWDIHMELPYGTMSDDEMRQLPVPSLQDDGLLFLWVTGRAMELGRECLKLWGYERVDEIIWVKTNQLQRIIRTGRTGHWLNHGKEHCIVGMKGNLKLNRGLDSDVIVAEVRATSHKPDEIYGIIERLSPGTRKIELFGRPHNVQPNWVTLGNQLDGVLIHDEEMLKRFNTAYPDGYELAPGYKIFARQKP
uniref:mRNA m(6)A methyltransferase n=1 Tax=Lepeophtheirus salmonis TaxID=72036 RepID=A0A0K2T8Z7_LEPSM